MRGWLMSESHLYVALFQDVETPSAAFLPSAKMSARLVAPGPIMDQSWTNHVPIDVTPTADLPESIHTQAALFVIS